MCKDFSCIVTQSHQVVWKRGVSSHDRLEEQFKADYPELQDTRHVKVEITPDDGYINPKGDWTLKVDEDKTPAWWSGEHKLSAMHALTEWKREIYALINLEEARNPINPLKIKPHKVTKKDIKNLKQWASVVDSVGASVGASVEASVWDSVGASVGASVRASVRASVWDSVRASVRASVGASVGASVRDFAWAYIGSLINIWGGDYNYQFAVDLWKRGFVPSYDGTTWRLHAGEDAHVVYEMK
jgi:hypothetical protein